MRFETTTIDGVVRDVETGEFITRDEATIRARVDKFVPRLDDDRPFNPTPYLMQFELRERMRRRTADILPNPFLDYGNS